MIGSKSVIFLILFLLSSCSSSLRKEKLIHLTYQTLPFLPQLNIQRLAVWKSHQELTKQFPEFNDIIPKENYIFFQYGNRITSQNTSIERIQWNDGTLKIFLDVPKFIKSDKGYVIMIPKKKSHRIQFLQNSNVIFVTNINIPSK